MQLHVRWNQSRTIGEMIAHSRASLRELQILAERCSEMAHTRTIRRTCRRFLRNRTVRWTVAILGIGFLLWYAFAPRANESQSSPQSLGDLMRAPQPAEPEPAYPQPSEPGAGRFTAVLYPYSVIPGGVESVEELRSALARDPAVAAHYAAFDLARARLVRMDQPRSAYVSYRLGGHIFWTSHKLTIRRGETVITDGDHTARTRCGNLVADVPMGPLSPREPTPEIFDTEMPMDMPMGPGPEVESPPTSEWMLKPPTIGISPPDPGGGVYIPFTPLPFDGPLLPITPSVPTPEPNILVLVAAGLAMLLVFRRGLDRKRGRSQRARALRAHANDYKRSAVLADHSPPTSPQNPTVLQASSFAPGSRRGL